MLLEDPQGQDAEITSRCCVQLLAGVVWQLLLGQSMVMLVS